MPSRVEPSDESPCNATAIREVTRRMTQLYDDALAPGGLRSTQYAILEELRRQANAPPTMGELAETLVLDWSALGHNLRPLERDSLIALIAGDDDRRRRHEVLTTRGRVKFARARRDWKLAQDRFNDVFGDLGMGAVDEVLYGKLARPVRGARHCGARSTTHGHTMSTGDLA